MGDVAQGTGSVPCRMRHSIPGFVLAAAKVVGFAFSIEPVFHPHARKYKGKAMRIRAVGYFGMLFAVPVRWLVRGRREPYPVLRDLALSVPLLLDSGGNSLGIYDDARIDDVVHFTNTAILSTAFGAAISPHVGSRWAAGALATTFGVTGELCWEVLEYTADRVGFRGLSLSRADTTADIAEGVLGAIVAGAITAHRWRRQPESGSPEAETRHAVPPDS
jgi:hypothetical protein